MSNAKLPGAACYRCGISVLALAAMACSSYAVSAQDTQAQPGEETGQSSLEAGSVPVTPPPPAAELPPVEEIITDEEFNSSIPDLGADDPELIRDIESIEEFERRFAAENATDDTEALAAEVPGGLPELADGDRSEEIADAPIRDAELLQPLSPLDQFEVREVEFAEDAADEEILTVEYAVVVNGLEEADRQTEIDLAGSYKSLSALEASDREVANVAMLAARAEEDSFLLQRLLRSEGWYDAVVTTRVERSEAANGQPLTAILDAAPGERFVFSDIVIEAEPTVPAGLIEKNLALQVGEPIIAARVQGAEAQVAIALPQQGYPFVDIGQRDILLDQETADGVYTLPVDIGPRSRFGGFTTSGDLAFDAEHVGVLARFERGELFDSRKVDDLRDALVATGLFNTVTVQPEQTGEAAGDGTEFVTIAVEQNAGPARSLGASAGFGTGQGFLLEGSWTHRNLFPPEGALIASAVLGTQEQGLGATFRRSNAGRRDRTVELGLTASHTNYDAFEAFTGRLGGLVSYSSTPIWQKRFTYAYGAEVIASVEEDFDFDLGERVDRTYFIGALTGQVGFDTTESLLDPTSGFRLNAFIQPEGSLQDGFSPYVRAILGGSAYYPIGRSIVLAGRLKAGTIQGVDRTDIAPSRRFYAGGGGSVRGFGFQQLGPRIQEANPNFDPEDPDETADPFVLNPIGGLSVIEGAAEVRYRFGDFGVVGFVDAGQVYESSTPGFSDIRYGVGIGGRYYTNFGPLRLDVATPIGRRDGESAFSVYISIGQAF
ncbi:BamA/TamA family outer membrane protein [Altererythrobacter sp.]|nr:BamA/TamA family outer membrane protein [Altererythrobacter sp.]